MDKYIASFLEEFGDPEESFVPDEQYVASYENKLPSMLLSTWREFGFCRFLGGLLWIVDPAEYRDILRGWIEGSLLREDDDSYHVIARSGYGDLYLWGESSGFYYKINPMNGWIIKQENALDNLVSSIQYFFSAVCPYTVDIEDADSDEEMFEEAVELHGELSKSEIFGFVPALVAGGDMVIGNLQKVDMAVHLDLLLAFKEPQIITTDDLTRMAFS